MCAKKIKISATQREYMDQACFMVRFWRHFSETQKYNYIEKLLNESSPRAGGPALRLANSVWDFEYRQLFPHTEALVVREENSFAHLKEAYNPTERQKTYRVYQAIAAFIKMREKVYGGPLLVSLEKEELLLPERQKLIRTFGLFEEVGGEKVVRIAQLLLSLNPAERPQVVAYMLLVAEVVHARVVEKSRGVRKQNKLQAFVHQNPWIKKTDWFGVEQGF